MATKGITYQFAGAEAASGLTSITGGKNGAIVSILDGSANVEIKELRGDEVYQSVTDSTDSIDTTKKLVTSTNNSRVVDAGFRGAIESTGAATVYVYHK